MILIPRYITHKLHARAQMLPKYYVLNNTTLKSSRLPTETPFLHQRLPLATASRYPNKKPLSAGEIGVWLPRRDASPPPDARLPTLDLDAAVTVESNGSIEGPPRPGGEMGPTCAFPNKESKFCLCSTAWLVRRSGCGTKVDTGCRMAVAECGILSAPC